MCFLLVYRLFVFLGVKVSWNRTIDEKLRQECLVKTCKSEVWNSVFLKKLAWCRCVCFFGDVSFGFWKNISLRQDFCPNRMGDVFF